MRFANGRVLAYGKAFEIVAMGLEMDTIHNSEREKRHIRRSWKTGHEKRPHSSGLSRAVCCMCVSDFHPLVVLGGILGTSIAVA
jgi:hypothetical protein